MFYILDIVKYSTITKKEFRLRSLDFKTHYFSKNYLRKGREIINNHAYFLKIDMFQDFANLFTK